MELECKQDGREMGVKSGWISMEGRKDQGGMMWCNSPGEQTQLVILGDAQVAAGGDVANSHRMEPVDESAGPFRPR